MSCACKFIPEFAGSNLQKETNLLQNNKINSEETSTKFNFHLLKFKNSANPN